MVDRFNAGDDSGWIIHSMLQKDGMITEESLCSWWLNNARFNRIRCLLEKEFVDIQCVEHRGLNSRWRVDGNGMKGIGNIFLLLEESKIEYEIVEYAVSQTSLEQIFMRFASEQADIDTVVHN